MPEKQLFSVLIPYLGNLNDLFISIESCLKISIVEKIIIFDNQKKENISIEIDKKFRNNNKIIIEGIECKNRIYFFKDLIKKINSKFISYILPGEKYIHSGFNELLINKLLDNKLRIILCNTFYINSDDNFVSKFSSVNLKNGLSSFEDGLILSTSSLFINKEYLDQNNINISNINLVNIFNLYLKTVIKKKKLIYFLDNDLIQVPIKNNKFNMSIYNSNWELVVKLANVLLNNGSKDIKIYLKNISKELFYLYNIDALRKFKSFKELENLNEEILFGIEENLELFKFDYQNRENFKNKEIPKELSLFLKNRPDLIALNFHKKKNERKLCKWIVKYGFKEESYFFKFDSKNNAIIEWLSKDSSDSDSNLSRISQAIWDSSSLIRFFWKKPFNKKIFEMFLQIFWFFIPLNLPPKKFIFKRRKYKKSVFLIIKSLKRFIFFDKNPPKEGVNLIGYAKHSLGIGEDLRTTFFALKAVKVSSSIINFNPGSCKKRYDKTLKRKISSKAPYNTTIVCLTAEETLRFIRKNGFKYFNRRYVIGYWPWELPRWPKAWIESIDFVNEIWVSTTFIKQSLNGITNKPIKVMPLCVDKLERRIVPQTPSQVVQNRLNFGLDINKKYIIMGFDLNSYIARKNPYGALDCFQKAFPLKNKENYSENVGLVVKTYKSTKINREWEFFKYLISTDKRIVVIEENMDKEKLLNLFGCCDVYMSLHRSEGFGRCLAESFQLGLDVLATDWSGNRDYCEGPLYHPVPYKLNPVKPGDYPYWANQYWADPDIDFASKELKNIIKSRANKKVIWDYQKQFSAINCGLRYKSRLKKIGLINEF